MNESGTFWALVRHEFKLKGSWKKQNRSRLPKLWWVIYSSIIIAAAFGLATYFAIQQKLELANLWFATTGFPYMIAFWGIGTLKKEWENETQGWWLTLPYPRLWLVSAKWIGALLQILVCVIGVFIIGSLYVLGISFFLSQYTMSDAVSFFISGLSWNLLVIGFSPFIVAFGLLTASSQYTRLNPISPILWILFLGVGSLFYWGSGFFNTDGSIFQQFISASLIPFSWELPLFVLISWLAAYLIIRLTAYLLDKKLSL